jgi:hypothetical protein
VAEASLERLDDETGVSCVVRIPDALDALGKYQSGEI